MAQSEVLVPQRDSERQRITPRSERRSSDFLTKYEVAKVIGERARQLAAGARPFAFDAGRRKESSSGVAAAASGLAPSLTPLSIASFGSVGSSSGGDHFHQLQQARCAAIASQYAATGSQASTSSNIGSVMLSTDPVMIAKYELLDGCIPFLVRRSFPGGHMEDIPVNELRVDPAMLDLVHLR